MLEKAWNRDQELIKIKGISLTPMEKLKIDQQKKIIKLRTDLEKKYNQFLPSDVSSFEGFMENVKASDKLKVLKSLVKIAKNDFKTLKPDHFLFKQNKLSTKQLENNLKILYGDAADQNISVTLSDIENVLKTFEL